MKKIIVCGVICLVLYPVLFGIMGYVYFYVLSMMPVNYIKYENSNDSLMNLSLSLNNIMFHSMYIINPVLSTLNGIVVGIILYQNRYSYLLSPLFILFWMIAIISINIIWYPATIICIFMSSIASFFASRIISNRNKILTTIALDA